MILLFLLSACGKQEQALDPSFDPPIEKIYWGMSPEEVTEILSMPKEYQSSNDRITTYTYGDVNVFGYPADIEMIFDTQSNMGLLEMYISYADVSDDSIRERLTEQYGDFTAVDRDGNACQWKSISIGELPSDIQDKFRAVNVEYLAHKLNGEKDFSQETMWNSLKNSALVQVNFNNGIIHFDAQHMAAYRLYEDNTSYESLLDYLLE